MLGLYLDGVLPSEYGSKKQVFFCLKRAFWCQKKQIKFIFKKPDTSVEENTQFETSYMKEDFYETVPLQTLKNPQFLVIENARKVY